MPDSKHVLILANSVKHWPGVCIAGREILSRSKSYSIGPWIRPVSANGEGELSPSETKLAGSKQPAVMDFIEVPFSHHVGDPLQPENWLIDASQRWRSVNAVYQRPSLELLTEEPKSIWLQKKNERVDRVSPEYLKKTPPDQSLYLIHILHIPSSRHDLNGMNGTGDTNNADELCSPIAA